jgi:hypothetical protein
MYDSVSRYVQLGSFRLYQPEDYVMLIVFVRSAFKDLRDRADGFPGLLHQSHHHHEYRGPNGYEPHATL